MNTTPNRPHSPNTNPRRSPLARALVLTLAVPLALAACGDADTSGGNPDDGVPLASGDLSRMRQLIAADETARFEGAEACLAIDAGRFVSFGVVAVGATAELDLGLTNCGSSPLTLVSLDADGDAPFTVVDALPLTLPAGAEAAVTVAFEPAAATGYVDEVTFAFAGVELPASLVFYGATPDSGGERADPEPAMPAEAPVRGCLHADRTALDGLGPGGGEVWLGPVAKGERAYGLLMFENCGETTMPVEGMYAMWDSDDMAWLSIDAGETAMPWQLAPSESRVTLVECAPFAHMTGQAPVLVPLHVYENGSSFGMGLTVFCECTDCAE